VQPLIEATWHYGQAGQWQKAYDLMQKEGLFEYLRLWGGNAVLLELDRLLLPPEKWDAKPVQAAFLYNNLGLVYDALGQKQEALRYYQQALAISREVGDRAGEGTTLWNIGALYFEQGRNDAALACFLRARNIYEEVLSPNREGVQRWIERLRKKAGEEEFAALLAKVEPQASLIVEQALREGL
jgi:tetratricopeptide (TPR) repeat protein